MQEQPFTVFQNNNGRESSLFCDPDLGIPGSVNPGRIVLRLHPVNQGSYIHNPGIHSLGIQDYTIMEYMCQDL